MKNFGGQTKVCQTSTGDDVHMFKCDQFQHSPLLRMYVCASLFSTVSPAESRQASARGGPSSGDYVCSHVHMVCVCVRIVSRPAASELIFNEASSSGIGGCP